MSLDIFDSTKHWSYTVSDEAAEYQFSELINEARESLPEDFFLKYHEIAPKFIQSMKKSNLYTAFKTLPKGVLHNVFFDCCEDRDFVLFDSYSSEMLLPTILMSMLLKISFPSELETKTKPNAMAGSPWKKQRKCINLLMTL